MSSTRFDGSSPVAGVPLVLGDTSLRIGVLTGLTQGNPGDWPGTEGRFVVVLAQLADSPLARAAFEAMRAGILDGVCGMFKGRRERGFSGTSQRGGRPALSPEERRQRARERKRRWRAGDSSPAA
jgi:hypothetical protein